MHGSKVASFALFAAAHNPYNFESGNQSPMATTKKGAFPNLLNPDPKAQRKRPFAEARVLEAIFRSLQKGSIVVLVELEHGQTCSFAVELGGLEFLF